MIAAASVSARLQAAGLALPAAMGAAANYTPHVTTRLPHGLLMHTAGQGPYRDGRLHHLGRVLTQAQAAAQLQCHGGTLDRARCLRLGIFLYCRDGFAQIERIADAASDVVVTALAKAGRHTRSIAGMCALPMRMSVEIDGIFLFED